MYTSNIGAKITRIAGLAKRACQLMQADKIQCRSTMEQRVSAREVVRFENAVCNDKVADVSKVVQGSPDIVALNFEHGLTAALVAVAKGRIQLCKTSITPMYLPIHPQQSLTMQIR